MIHLQTLFRIVMLGETAMEERIQCHEPEHVCNHQLDRVTFTSKVAGKAGTPRRSRSPTRCFSPRRNNAGTLQRDPQGGVNVMSKIDSLWAELQADDVASRKASLAKQVRP